MSSTTTNSASTTVRPWRRGAISSPGQIAPGAGTGYSKPEPQPKEKEPRLWPPPPPVRFCIRRGEQCEEHFPAAEDSECCPWCRADLRAEADLNKLDISLPEQELIDALAAINQAESKIVLHSYVARRERDRGDDRAAELHRRRVTLRSIEKATLVNEKAAA